MQKSQHRRSANKNEDGHHHQKAKHFGEHITADHAFVGDDEAGRSGERVALIVQDEATKWLSAYPSLGKDADGVCHGFHFF